MAGSDNMRREGKILDAWIPPENAGDPIGCMATTFTFSPVFFEEECLGRFLQMESDANQDGPVYLIEREEKLAGLSCATVLVDASHCRGMRSLRWDLLSARVPAAILHAKVSLLQWSNCIRLIVGSANLTEDGYRRNQEVFAVLDYMDGSDAPLQCLSDTVVFLQAAVGYAGIDEEADSPALKRWLSFLDNIVAVSGNWGRTEDFRGRKSLRVHLITTSPDRPSVFSQFKDIWPGASAPSYASVTSPFFDKPGASNFPARELWRNLRGKGEAEVAFNVTADEIEGENAILLHAPRALLDSQPKGRRMVNTFFYRMQERESDQSSAFRPLHMKCLEFQDGDWVGQLLGSSNFTSAGLGLSKNPNLEANLVYFASRSGNPSTVKKIERSLPQGEEFDKGIEIKWQLDTDDGEDSPGETDVPLPPAFGQAVYERTANAGKVILTFAAAPPTGWNLKKDSGEDFLDEDSWELKGSPQKLVLDWPEDRPPSGFNVTWDGCPGLAWWPVNVDKPASLPPPEELKDLPLAVLIDILTSARPLHQAYRAWMGKRHEAWPGPELDPLKKVDSSAFLLQKTRRISWGLVALRERLERPVASPDALEWRLSGPVGVEALATAIQKEAQTDSEKAFLLAELALELSRVIPRSAPGHLPSEIVKDALGLQILELEIQARNATSKTDGDIRRYLKVAFKEAKK